MGGGEIVRGILPPPLEYNETWMVLCICGQILKKCFLNHFCFCEHVSIPDVRIIAQIDNQTLYDE